MDHNDRTGRKASAGATSGIGRRQFLRDLRSIRSTETTKTTNCLLAVLEAGAEPLCPPGLVQSQDPDPHRVEAIHNPRAPRTDH